MRSVMRARDHAYTIVHTLGSAADLRSVRAARVIASNVLDSAKNRCITSRLEEAASPEAKWRELRIRVSGSSTPSRSRYFDSTTLNTHFAATVNRHTPITELDYDSIVQQRLCTHINRQFCLPPVTTNDVLQAINPSSSKASRLDGISTRMIKLAMRTALTNFISLINSSIIDSVPQFLLRWNLNTQLSFLADLLRGVLDLPVF